MTFVNMRTPHKREAGEARRLIRMAIVATLVASLSAPACGQNAGKGKPALSDAIPEPLSVEQAVQIGIERNPQTAAGLAGIATAAGNYRSLAAFPPLNLGITNVTGNSSAPSLNGATSDTFFDVGGTLDTSGQRHFQAESAKSQWKATRFQFTESTLTLAQQIRDAYWGLVSARAQTVVAQETLADVRRVNELTKTQLAAGAAPRGDVIRSSIDAANAEQSYVSAQGAEHVALIAFNTLLQRSPEAPVVPADSLTETMTTPSPLPNLPTLPDLMASARQNRPLLRAAQEQVRAADYTLKQTKAARLPDVSVDYERSLRDPTYSVLAGIHFPLLDFGSVRESIRSAEASKRQAQAQEQQADQQIAQQVAQAYTDYTQARLLASKYQADILTPSVTLLNMAQLGYKQGATGILPVIDAENTLRNARNGYIGSLLALYKAQDEILAATGTPLPAQPKSTANESKGQTLLSVAATESKRR